MTQPIPLWCLHWSRDGELAPGDRLDLLHALVLQDSCLSHLMLSQAAQWPERSAPSMPPLGRCGPDHTLPAGQGVH